jgi:hypothetical protein
MNEGTGEIKLESTFIGESAGSMFGQEIGVLELDTQQVFVFATLKNIVPKSGLSQNSSSIFSIEIIKSEGATDLQISNYLSGLPQPDM